MILPWLILIPFIGGLLCWQTERFGNTLPRWIALLTMGLLFGLGLWLWASAPTARRAGLGRRIPGAVDRASRHQHPPRP
jgi:NADH-quinone oxidoreductase subunit M